MASSSPFKEKIEKLQAATEEGQRKLDAKVRSIPTNVIIGVIVPFVVLLILVFLWFRPQGLFPERPGRFTPRAAIASAGKGE